MKIFILFLFFPMSLFAKTCYVLPEKDGCHQTMFASGFIPKESLGVCPKHKGEFLRDECVIKKVEYVETIQEPVLKTVKGETSGTVEVVELKKKKIKKHKFVIDKLKVVAAQQKRKQKLDKKKQWQKKFDAVYGRMKKWCDAQTGIEKDKCVLMGVR